MVITGIGDNVPDCVSDQLTACVEGLAVQRRPQLGPHGLGLAAEDGRADRPEPRKCGEQLADAGRVALGPFPQVAQVVAVLGADKLGALPERGGRALVVALVMGAA